jgi:hypothetical protein
LSCGDFPREIRGHRCCRTAGKSKKGWLPPIQKYQPSRSLLDLFNDGVFSSNRRDTLEFKAAKSVLIKIKNQPEEKPENSAMICQFLFKGIRQ